MLIKISKEIERKLYYISKKNNISKDVMIESIFNGFFKRYTEKHGEIPQLKHKKVTTISYQMFMIYKKIYFHYFGQEYSPDKKFLSRDMRAFKNIAEKISNLVLEKDKTVIIVETESVLLAWITFLGKIDDWWKQNAFTPQQINKNFDTIIHQIKNKSASTKQRRNNERKSKIDDFIEELGKEFAFDNA